MRIVQMSLKKKDDKRWIPLIIKVGAIENDIDMACEIYCPVKPPDIRMVDGDSVYYIQYFADIIEANNWLSKFVETCGIKEKGDL